MDKLTIKTSILLSFQHITHVVMLKYFLSPEYMQNEQKTLKTEGWLKIKNHTGSLSYMHVS